jgi:hypothetical protein
VRRLLTWLTGAASGIALYRWLSRARRPVAEVPEATLDPRAAELRARLEESRALVDEREQFEAGETAVDEAEPGLDPAERRRRVHEQGRAAVDEMRRSE